MNTSATDYNKYSNNNSNVHEANRLSTSKFFMICYYDKSNKFSEEGNLVAFITPHVDEGYNISIEYSEMPNANIVIFKSYVKTLRKAYEYTHHSMRYFSGLLREGHCITSIQNTKYIEVKPSIKTPIKTIEINSTPKNYPFNINSLNPFSNIEIEPSMRFHNDVSITGTVFNDSKMIAYQNKVLIDKLVSKEYRIKVYDNSNYNSEVSQTIVEPTKEKAFERALHIVSNLLANELDKLALS